MKKSELLSEIIANNVESGQEVDSKFTEYKFGLSSERYEITTIEQSKFYRKDIGIYDDTDGTFSYYKIVDGEFVPVSE